MHHPKWPQKGHRLKNAPNLYKCYQKIKTRFTSSNWESKQVNEDRDNGKRSKTKQSPGGYTLVDGIRGCSKVLGCFFVTFGTFYMCFCYGPNLKKKKKNTTTTTNKHTNNWVQFGKCVQTRTQFVPNWEFFASVWYSDGSQNHTFRVIEMVEILKATLSIPVQSVWRPPSSIYPNPAYREN